MGLIEYKEIKKGGNSCIIKINMNHAKIKNWTPTINKPWSNTKNESKVCYLNIKIFIKGKRNNWRWTFSKSRNYRSL